VYITWQEQIAFPCGDGPLCSSEWGIII